MDKQNRLIELLLKKITLYDIDDDKELLGLISFYKERVNVESRVNYSNLWNWTGFDYNKGYEDAKSKYLKVIKNKDEEIKQLWVKKATD
jgi:hypothetical protein